MLTAFLAERTEPIVELTFAELDRLIGGLPASAREHPAWWTNSRSAQPHARYWLDAKRRARADFNAARVRFEIGAESVGHGLAKPIAEEPSQATAESVEVVEATVRFEWRNASAAALDAARKPVFPAVPLHPGVYRFKLADGDGTLLGIYIGESDNLTRRMGNYRNPGPTQPTNQRMNKRFRDVLSMGGSVEVAVSTQVTVDGEFLDLSERPARLVAENVALIRARQSGFLVENL